MQVMTSALRLSLPSRGAWIEIGHPHAVGKYSASLPSRGAWIEITAQDVSDLEYQVAPLTGSVDRNPDL